LKSNNAYSKDAIVNLVNYLAVRAKKGQKKNHSFSQNGAECLKVPEERLVRYQKFVFKQLRNVGLNINRPSFL